MALTREMVESLIRVRHEPFVRTDGSRIEYFTLVVGGVDVSQWAGGAVNAEKMKKRVALAIWSKIRPHL